MLQKQFYKTDDGDLDRLKIIECLQLSKFGLEIPPRKLVKIMGKQNYSQFIDKRQTHFDSYIKNQFLSNYELVLQFN